MIKLCISCNKKPVLTKNLCTGCYSKYRYNNNSEVKRTRLKIINEYNLKLKKILVSWIGEKKCSRCAVENLPYSAYEFHHLDMTKKEFTIGKLPKSLPNLLKNEEVIKKELSNCILLCANCHRTIHSSEYIKEVK